MSYGLAAKKVQDRNNATLLELMALAASSANHTDGSHIKMTARRLRRGAYGRVD
jgi:hypothetical protein